ncbi:MAG: LON peptidase substrate-binding domain-containing protein, partial [SAR202 cluster bacterium]|nr:LON peptidase substrate-binding domain-containing protein [SAR202 cluster bacterium]
MVNREAQKIPLFPLSTVLFPGGTIPLQIFEDRYHSMVQDCLDTDSKFGIVLIKEGQEVGGNAVPHKVGTLARITKIRKLPQNRLYLTAVGETRFNIIELIQDKAYLEGLVEIHNPPPAEDIEEQSLKEAQTAAFRHLKAIVSMNGGWVKKAQTPLPTDPDQLSFFLAQLIQGSNKVRQTILEEASIKK